MIVFFVFFYKQMITTGIFHALMLAATVFSSRFLGKVTTSVNIIWSLILHCTLLAQNPNLIRGKTGSVSAKKISQE